MAVQCCDASSVGAAVMVDSKKLLFECAAVGG